MGSDPVLVADAFLDAGSAKVSYPVAVAEGYAG